MKLKAFDLGALEEQLKRGARIILTITKDNILFLTILKIDIELLPRLLTQHKEEIIGPVGKIKTMSQIKEIFEALKNTPERIKIFTELLDREIADILSTIEQVAEYYQLLKDRRLSSRSDKIIDKAASLIKDVTNFIWFLQTKLDTVYGIELLLQKIPTCIFQSGLFQIDRLKNITDLSLFTAVCKSIAKRDGVINFSIETPRIPIRLMYLSAVQQEIVLNVFKEQYRQYFSRNTFAKFSYHAGCLLKQQADLLLDLIKDKLPLLSNSAEFYSLIRCLDSDCIKTALSMLTQVQLLDSFTYDLKKYDLAHLDLETLEYYFEKTQAKLSPDSLSFDSYLKIYEALPSSNKIRQWFSDKFPPENYVKSTGDLLACADYVNLKASLLKSDTEKVIVLSRDIKKLTEIDKILQNLDEDVQLKVLENNTNNLITLLMNADEFTRSQLHGFINKLKGKSKRYFISTILTPEVCLKLSPQQSEQDKPDSFAMLLEFFTEEELAKNCNYVYQRRTPTGGLLAKLNTLEPRKRVAVLRQVRDLYQLLQFWSPVLYKFTDIVRAFRKLLDGVGNVDEEICKILSEAVNRVISEVQFCSIETRYEILLFALRCYHKDYARKHLAEYYRLDNNVITLSEMLLRDVDIQGFALVCEQIGAKRLLDFLFTKSIASSIPFSERKTKIIAEYVREEVGSSFHLTPEKIAEFCSKLSAKKVSIFMECWLAIIAKRIKSFDSLFLILSKIPPESQADAVKNLASYFDAKLKEPLQIKNLFFSLEHQESMPNKWLIGGRILEYLAEDLLEKLTNFIDEQEKLKDKKTTQVGGYQILGLNATFKGLLEKLRAVKTEFKNHYELSNCKQPITELAQKWHDILESDESINLYQDNKSNSKSSFFSPRPKEPILLMMKRFTTELGAEDCKPPQRLMNVC